VLVECKILIWLNAQFIFNFHFHSNERPNKLVHIWVISNRMSAETQTALTEELSGVLSLSPAKCGRSPSNKKTANYFSTLYNPLLIVL
jgi:hypothetical protein